jgi:hypothetical protein
MAFFFSWALEGLMSLGWVRGTLTSATSAGLALPAVVVAVAFFDAGFLGAVFFGGAVLIAEISPAEAGGEEGAAPESLPAAVAVAASSLISLIVALLALDVALVVVVLTAAFFAAALTSSVLDFA